MAVGEAFLSAFLQVLFDRLASRKVLDFFQARKLNKKLVNKLMATIRSVNKVLTDAEEKQITDPAVKHWLDDLRVAVYEADDLLDEIAYEDLRSNMEAGSQSSSSSTLDQVQNFFTPFNLLNEGLEAKLEKILENLEELLEEKDALGLIEGIGETSRAPKMPTTSLLADSDDVYGRTGDKEAIMNLLLSKDADGTKVGVISIVGMGGIGKTTLAQLVYNDTSVQHHFDLKAWVCVSEDFDYLKVTRDILKEVGLGGCDNWNENQLQLKLKDHLIGKKFFLVLDDIWSDDRSKWGFVLTPLKAGWMEGSKIVVTTRQGGIASALSSVLTHVIVSTHRLLGLSPDDCWSVFANHAFDDVNSGSRERLKNIGREIVGKCNGLPLAAKSLGSLLRSNADVDEWEEVLKSNMWDLRDGEILPALRLSYHYLPSHLKRCFAYCSLFPKDYVFEKEELVLLWIAEGFLEPPKGTMNEGYKCFDNLVSRSFFQPSRTEPSYFFMHDLIIDLAKFISGDFCFRFDNENSSKPSKKVRHSSLEYNEFENFVGIHGARFLRSLLFIMWPWKLKWNDECRRLDFLKSLDRLRVLSLSQYYIVADLPDSIGHLKLLRYLNLQGTLIKRLPESVCDLYLLQVMILCGCFELTELPRNLTKLMNLFHLDIRGTRLQSMPPRMSKLEKLQILTDFFVGNQTGSKVAELGKLQLLQGRLIIHKVVNVEDAKEANLKSLKRLKELELSWGHHDIDRFSSEHELRVLEGLQPHTNLRSLDIRDYWGTRFPQWVGDSSYSNLVSLRLIGCKFCCTLPPLGQLASLECLSIRGFDAITTVGPEFFGSCPSLFGSLKCLRFEDMQNWHEWICGIDDGAFPLLEELDIQDCPNLTNSLPSDLPSLARLKITRCEQLVTPASILKAPNIKRITLCSGSNYIRLEQGSLQVCGSYTLDYAIKALVSVATIQETVISRFSVRVGDFSFSNLVSLNLLNCTYCCTLPPLGQLPSLEHLSIEGFDAITTVGPEFYGSCPLPFVSLETLRFERMWNWHEWICDVNDGAFPLLKELRIIRCPNLTNSLPSHLPSLTNLESSGCEKLVAPLPKGPNIKYIWLDNGSNSIHFEEGSLAVCGSDTLDYAIKPIVSTATIREIVISDCDMEVLCGNEGTLGDFTSLWFLQISDCPNLKWLPEGMHSLFPRLTELSIYNCPEIEEIPEGRFPSKLESLVISDCMKLTANFGIQWDLQSLPSFTHLHIEVESFPERELLPPTLTSLSISKIQNFGSLDHEKTLRHLTSLTELSISYWPHLQSISEEGLPSTLISLQIWSLENLQSLQIQHLTSLKELEIEFCPELESLPEDWLPSTLTSLQIRGLDNLQSLGIQHLTSLADLKIYECLELESIPDLPSSLSLLHIARCPLLAERYQREEGEDWPKDLSHPQD